MSNARLWLFLMTSQNLRLMECRRKGCRDWSSSAEEPPGSGKFNCFHGPLGINKQFTLAVGLCDFLVFWRLALNPKTKIRKITAYHFFDVVAALFFSFFIFFPLFLPGDQSSKTLLVLRCLHSGWCRNRDIFGQQHYQSGEKVVLDALMMDLTNKIKAKLQVTLLLVHYFLLKYKK